MFKKRRRHEKASERQQPVHSQGLTNAASRFWLQGAAVLGSLIPPAKHGHLGCPPAVIALRTAVAALPGVKELRPKALPTKLIAVGAPTSAAHLLHLPARFTLHPEVMESHVFLPAAGSIFWILEASTSSCGQTIVVETCKACSWYSTVYPGLAVTELLHCTAGLAVGLLNVPFGGLREHVDKFSPEWFLAVHATIPFVAALRKAVMMPRWAVVLTIASAVAGQIAGSQVERQRVRGAAQAPPASSSKGAEHPQSSVSLGLSLSSATWQPSVQLEAGGRAPAGLQSCGMSRGQSPCSLQSPSLAAVR